MSALRGCQDVTGRRGAKGGKNKGREGKAERRHNQVRRGDRRGGKGWRGRDMVHYRGRRVG